MAENIFFTIPAFAVLQYLTPRCCLTSFKTYSLQSYKIGETCKFHFSLDLYSKVMLLRSSKNKSDKLLNDIPVMKRSKASVTTIEGKSVIPVGPNVDPLYTDKTQIKLRKIKSTLPTAQNISKDSFAEPAKLKTELEQPKPRPDPVNTEYMPFPWQGRLGYACLNTVLRARKVPVFSSRTCRLASIEKAEALGISEGRGSGEGLKLLQSLGKQNAADLNSILEWNVAHDIKFMRISSEMFPFSSHDKYKYDLEFAQEELEAAGRTANRHNIRLTMHPGQFTQLGSPRESVTKGAVAGLIHHDELLTRLKLRPDLDRDAVLVIHMGGVYGDKTETFNRFRINYSKLPDGVKRRLVLENDDVCYTVKDLLPLCKELNIPLVLDWHHHNVLHEDCFRYGNLDLLPLLPEIKETWTKKGIKQKQHYSEPRYPDATTGMKLRIHSDRVFKFPPCDVDMDLMIEAKEKEQAVFELRKRNNIEDINKQPRAIVWPPKGGLEGDEGSYYPPEQSWRISASDRQKAKMDAEASKEDCDKLED